MNHHILKAGPFELDTVLDKLYIDGVYVHMSYYNLKILKVLLASQLSPFLNTYWTFGNLTNAVYGNAKPRKPEGETSKRFKDKRLSSLLYHTRMAHLKIGMALRTKGYLVYFHADSVSMSAAQSMSMGSPDSASTVTCNELPQGRIHERF